MASEVLRLDTAKLKHERVFLSILIPYFQTPAEYARSNGKKEVADMIDKYKVRSGIECGVSVSIFLVFVTFLPLSIRVLFSPYLLCPPLLPLPFPQCSPKLPLLLLHTMLPLT